MGLKPWQTITPQATILWAKRAYGDFQKKAPPSAPQKRKDTGKTKNTCWISMCSMFIGSIEKFLGWRTNFPEKMAQRDLPGMRDLMEVCCLWVALLEPIRLHVGDGPGFEHLEAMFLEGNLGITLGMGRLWLNSHKTISKPCINWYLDQLPNYTSVFKNRCTA